MNFMDTLANVHWGEATETLKSSSERGKASESYRTPPT